MSLLDSDSEIIKKINEKSETNKSGRKAKTSGLNRFANSLNKYKHLANEHRKNSDSDTDSTNNSPKPNQVELDADDKLNKSTDQVDLTKKSPDILTVDSKIKTRSIEKIEPDLISKEEVKFEVKEISDKLNWQSTINKTEENLDSDQIIIEYNSDNNKSTNESTLEYQLGNNKSTNESILEYQLDNNESTQGVQIGVPIGVQIQPEFPLVRLLGGQKRKLLNLFFEDCKYQGSLNTGKLLNESLSNAMDVKPSTLKTLVYRLSKDFFIERLPGKRGRGGWIQVTIPKPIYDQLLALNSISVTDIFTQTLEHNKSTNRETHWSTNPPSSSSVNSSYSTTTTRELPKNWQIIQIPQILKDIGISTAHIIQIANDGFLSPDEVQDSLEAFSYDLEQGSVNARLGPLRLLLGVLRKQKVPYVSQAMIELERKQLQDYMKKKEEAEAIKKQQTELGLIKKFEVWWEGLSQNQRNQVAPPNNFIEEGGHMQKKIGRGNFLENPDLVLEFTKNNGA